MTGGHRLLTRRRAITLLAAAAGLPLGASSRRAPPVFEWQGQALGARARLILAHPDPAAARRAAAHAVAEIARLERIFSLFLDGSELTRLNRDGRLVRPSLDLRIVLAEACRLGTVTGGAFDVTVQPLWRLFRRHFAERPGDAQGPAPGRIAAARALVDYRAVDLDGTRIALARPGMAVTLNGIAQGYITDRVADLLRNQGFGRVLVQLGETRALGRPDPARPWRLAVPDPADPSRQLARLAVTDQAVATSSGPAARFEPSGRHHHIFDPATGSSAHGQQSVTVIAPSAMTADGLATALAVARPAAAPNMLRAGGGSKALILAAGGARRWFEPAIN